MIRRKSVFVFAIVITLIAVVTAGYSLFAAAVKGSTPAELAKYRKLYSARPEPGGTVHRDIVYKKGLFETQKLDIYMPTGTWDMSTTGVSRGVPAVVFVHGGSWMHGSKEDVRIIDRFLGKMRDEGWAFIAMDYVSGPIGLLDAPTRNVRTALTWIRENASNYGIDPENLGLYSVSAGSHLTLTALNASAAPSKDWRFWLSECGPMDLVAMADGESILASETLSRIPNRYLRNHSPVLYIDAPLPPTALVHGDADLMVALSQSERLAEHLAVFGTDVTLKIIPGGDHGFFGNSQEEWIDMEDDFVPFMRKNFLH